MTTLYKKSRNEAETLNEMTLWRESRKENHACAATIRDAINRNFDGMYLPDGCVGEVVSVYGYDRTMWVLAATMLYKDYDGRFSHDNKQWAASVIPSGFDRDELSGYVCDAHPAILNGFVDLVRREYAGISENFEQEQEGLCQC